MPIIIILSLSPLSPPHSHQVKTLWKGQEMKRAREIGPWIRSTPAPSLNPSIHPSHHHHHHHRHHNPLSPPHSHQLKTLRKGQEIKRAREQERLDHGFDPHPPPPFLSSLSLSSPSPLPPVQYRPMDFFRHFQCEGFSRVLVFARRRRAESERQPLTRGPATQRRGSDLHFT